MDFIISSNKIKKGENAIKKDGLLMDFIISSNKIKKGENAIILDSNTYSGIKKIAAKVALDLKAVFGAEPAVLENKTVKNPIYAGTVNDALIKDIIEKDTFTS